jgi:hypothetical protein
MVQCLCLKGSGDQCTRQANANSDYCWQHQNCSTPGIKPVLVAKPQNVVPTQTDAEFQDHLKTFFKHALKADLVDTIVKFNLDPKQSSISHLKSACMGVLYDKIKEHGQVIPLSYFAEIENKYLLHKNKKAQSIILQPTVLLDLTQPAILPKAGTKIPLKIKDNRQALIETFSKKATKNDYVKAIVQYQLDTIVINDLKQIMNDHLDQVPTSYFEERDQYFNLSNEKKLKSKTEFDEWFQIPEVGDTANITWSNGTTYQYMVMAVKNKGKDVDFLYTGPPLPLASEYYSFEDQPFKLKYFKGKGWTDPKYEWIHASVNYAKL